MQRPGTTDAISGYSSPSGEATARLFAGTDPAVAAIAHQPESARPNTTASLLMSCIEIEDTLGVEAGAVPAKERSGRIYALVTDAGIAQFAMSEAIPRDKICEQSAINAFGSMDAPHALLPVLRPQSCGTIVNIPADAGVFTLGGCSEARSRICHIATNDIVPPVAARRDRSEGICRPPARATYLPQASAA